MKTNKKHLINQIENKELIEEKSKTIRFLADKLEIEQLKNKELIDGIKLSIDNLEEKQKSFLGVDGEIPRANFKLGLDWAIESFKGVLNNDNQKT